MGELGSPGFSDQLYRGVYQSVVQQTKELGACLKRSFRHPSDISTIKFLGVVLAFLLTFENYSPRMGVGSGDGGGVGIGIEVSFF